ncbi:hypothetical protein PSACC_01779 [Paramicrosporidium saccamoebae]|uniref:Uncharacterized protein n=1 Tax=Paramicrosporidium saccamoebae TaxID=1246581 RepID=A0A2H9TKY2_9FUNG|nr:hypothetical protein PSACC_01779 [Paramicrosporidium saccamoebae]
MLYAELKLKSVPRLRKSSSQPLTRHFSYSKLMEGATVTVRIIKSFEYKNFRSLVFQNVDLHTATLDTLRAMVWERSNCVAIHNLGIRTTPGLKQYEQCLFDTFKMYYQAHGAKVGRVRRTNTGRLTTL